MAADQPTSDRANEALLAAEVAVSGLAAFTGPTAYSVEEDRLSSNITLTQTTGLVQAEQVKLFARDHGGDNGGVYDAGDNRGGYDDSLHDDSEAGNGYRF